MPVGKEVTVHVGRIEALREIQSALVNPVIEVGGHTLRLPVTIQPDEMIELGPGGVCTVYDRDNHQKQKIELTGVPVIQAGENTVRLRADGTMPYAYVTPILRGDELIR